MSAPRVLYLSYWGLASPLGRALCVPYLLDAARRGVARYVVISFETDPLPTPGLRRTIAEAGVEWIELRYHGRPKGLAKVYDIALGLFVALRAARRERFDLVHARSYVAGATALLLRAVAGTPYVFDMLGMLADEYADVGYWDRGGLFYRVTKAVERRMLRAARAVIVLTNKNAAYLHASGLVRTETTLSVVPCCTDTTRFVDPGGGYPRADAPRLVYAGSIGTWYLLDEMMALFAAASAITPNLRFRVITRGDHRVVRAAAAAAGVERGVEPIAAHPDDVPALLADCDAGVCFIRPSFSKDASSPTKFAEYLACGLPIIANRGVGDLDEALSDGAIGIAIDIGAGAYADAWRTLEHALRDDARALRDRCRRFAVEELSVQRATDEYAHVYAALARG